MTAEVTVRPDPVYVERKLSAGRGLRAGGREGNGDVDRGCRGRDLGVGRRRVGGLRRRLTASERDRSDRAKRAAQTFGGHSASPQKKSESRVPPATQATRNCSVFVGAGD